jgi:ribosomal protein L6P/L9E
VCFAVFTAWLRRSLANNMVVGVSTGFEKRMEMVGTGYRASVAGKELTLNVGYSKPRVLAIPDGITVKVRTLLLLPLLLLLLYHHAILVGSC